MVLNQPRKHLPATDLRSTFTTFESQLQALLGVPVLPPAIKSSDFTPVTDWQLDALVRRRTQENAEDSRETLQSIVSLVNQIQNMPVGQDVKGDVQNALNALDEVSGTPSFEEKLNVRFLLLGALPYSIVLNRGAPPFSQGTDVIFACFLQPGHACALIFPCRTYLCCLYPTFCLGCCTVVRCRRERDCCLETLASGEGGASRQCGGGEA